MTTIKSFLTISAAFVAMCLSASAGSYTDTNYPDKDLFEGESITGQWNYGPIGFGEIVTKVETWFTFSSGDTEAEQVKIDIGVGDGVTDFSNTSGTFNFGSNYVFNWSFNNASNASLLLDAANGTLKYTVTASSNRNVENDVTFDKAKVVVTTVSNHVPDGGTTIALIGISLLAFVGLQRKLRVAQ